MKLLNKSLLWLSASLFVVIGLWTVVLYYNVTDGITDSVDEGLEHYKRQIVYKAQTDSTILHQPSFDDGYYSLREISKAEALLARDVYIDTTLPMMDKDDSEPELEPMRMLRTAFENGGRFYELRIVNPMMEEDDLAEELLRDSVVLYVLLIVCVVLINKVILERLWHPFYSFLRQLMSYQIGGKVTFPAEVTTTKEFADLHHAVSVLLDRTTESYEKQKQFIGNASHELQTPLAIAISKLELLLESGGLSAEQAMQATEVLSIVERMVKLNKSLLLLTKIENKQFMDNQRLSLNALIKESCAVLHDYVEIRNINLGIQEDENLEVVMDATLASILTSNLIRNALFHNIEQGVVEIVVGAKSFTVRNTGKPEPLNVDLIFTRFSSQTEKSSGSGLGLAIVKAIADLYGYTIEYRYEHNKHSFEIIVAG